MRGRCGEGLLRLTLTSFDVGLPTGRPGKAGGNSSESGDIFTVRFRPVYLANKGCGGVCVSTATGGKPHQHARPWQRWRREGEGEGQRQTRELERERGRRR